MARPTSPHGSPHGPLHDSLHSNLHCGAGRGGGRGAGRGAAATPAARRAMEFAGGAGDADGLLVSDIPFGIHVVAVYDTEAVFRLEEPVLQGRPVDEHGPDFTLTVTIARWGGSIISEGRRVNWRLLVLACYSAHRRYRLRDARVCPALPVCTPPNPDRHRVACGRRGAGSATYGLARLPGFVRV